MSVIDIAQTDNEFSSLSPCAPIAVMEGRTAAQYVHSYRHWFEPEKKEFIQLSQHFDLWVAYAKTPSMMRARDRERTGTVENPNIYWSGILVSLQKRAILERAFQDPNFGRLLQKTGTQELVFHSDVDILREDSMGWGRNLMAFRDLLSRVSVVQLQDWQKPPSLELPYIPKGSIGWRMGAGEDYTSQFRMWYQDLDSSQKEEVQPYLRWGNKR